MEWSPCTEAGVRQRVLKLVKKGTSVECPERKILAKKCKKSTEECQFGSWSEWSACQLQGKERNREVNIRNIKYVLFQISVHSRY